MRHTGIIHCQGLHKHFVFSLLTYAYFSNIDSQIAVPATTTLPKTFVKFGNDSYKLVAQKMRWDEARRQCQADDADLASILNPISQAFITLQISKHQEPVWIGLNSNVVKGLPVTVHH